MTREELKTIVEGITEEQLKKVLDINSNDIGKAKMKGVEYKEEIERLNEVIKDLKANTEEVNDLKEKVKSYEEAEKNRKETEERIKVEQELQKRFEEFAKEKKFINEFTKQGIYKTFAEAIKDEQNKSKGDKEIFEDVIKDKENIFENPNKPKDITGIGNISTEGTKMEVPRFF